MTIQQGKDMNKQFVLLKDNLKKTKALLDTTQTVNSFLVDYNHAVVHENEGLRAENKDLSGKIGAMKDTVTAMTQRTEFERLRMQIAMSQSNTSMEMYKLEMQTKTDLFNVQLENERHRTRTISRNSAILGGLTVGFVALTAAVVRSWMPASWFK